MSKNRSGQTPAPSPGLADAKAGGNSAPSPRAELDAFLSQVNALGPAVKVGGRGRLVFALDATMSRQPTWDRACVLQADMFREAAAVAASRSSSFIIAGLWNAALRPGFRSRGAWAN